MRRLSLLIISLLLLIPLAQAQESDLAWLLDLLPTAADGAPIAKLLASAPNPLVVGDLLLQEDFSAVNAWENFSGVDQRAVVDDAHYEVFTQVEDVYMWGQGFDTYSNLAVMVETEQVSSELNNGYGITCRTTEDPTNADGYYFFISGDGYYTIFVRVDDTQETLREWTSSDLVNQGQGSKNRIMAVCHQDYLALYVNDVLATEVTDNRLSEGVLSLAAIVYEPDSNVEIHFDNLIVYSIEATETDPVITSTTPEIDADVLEADLQSLLTAGSRSVIIGELIQQETFDDADTWGEYDDDEGSYLRIENGVYNAYAQGDGGTIFWGINNTDYNNVVVQVEAQASETTQEAAFGIACRADSEGSGRGYYLLMGTDGYYTLIISNGNNYITTLEDRSDLITQTDLDLNTLTAVCVNDYLALYVNDNLIFEYEDTKFPEGRIGLTIVAYGEDGEIVDVHFDNALIWSAISFGSN